MKRILFDRCGAPRDVVRVEEVAEPGAPGPHQALVELAASPIHPADLLTIMGMYASDSGPLPKVAGKEAVGRVLAVGESVKHIKPGDITPMLFPNDGAWQELHLLPADGLVPLPPAGDILQYAMGIANPATALLMLRELVPVKMGEWVIQNAANSSVGQYLIQLAKRDGIRTVNVVRRQGLESQLHDLGADAVLVDGPDLPAQVARATGGAPIRLAIDSVSGEAPARLATCLTQNGVLCNYGMLSGRNVQVSPAHLIGKGITVRGFWVSSSPSLITPAGRAKLFGELIPLLAAGALKAKIEKTYKLDQALDALAHAAKGERSGKILFTL